MFFAGQKPASAVVISQGELGASMNFFHFVECQCVVVLLMPFLCWFRVGSMLVSCRFCAGFMHISCRYHAHSMYVPCMLVPGRGLHGLLPGAGRGGWQWRKVRIWEGNGQIGKKSFVV